MHQIDSSSATPSMPSPNPVGTPGWFAHGSAGTGTPFTVLTSDWANAVQAELINTIEGAGITLDKTNDAQLLAAILALPQRIADARGVAATCAGSTTSCTWTVGEVTAKTALAGLTTFGASLSLTVNLATTGIGGMDTGSAPVSADLSVYAAFNATTSTWGAFACAGSVSNGPVYTGSNLPTGYTYTSLIWSGVTNSSRQFVHFFQRQRKVAIGSATVLSGGTATTYTSVSLAGCVPANGVACSGSMDQTGASGCDIGADVTGICNVPLNVAATSVTSIQVPFWMPLESQALFYLVGTGSGATNLSISISSYEF